MTAQPENRAARETTPEHDDDARTPAAPLVATRLLANPRRVRRA
jgi:hypothetical protein